MKTLAFFNNKGGVGKTSLVYHLSWMFAEMGVNVVAIDLDTQSNLTSSFLEDEQLIELWDTGPSSRTIRGLIQPLLDRLGDIGPRSHRDRSRMGLIPGDLGLSLFEDRLAETWGRCFDDNTANASDAFRVTTAFYRIMEHAARQRCRSRPDRCRPDLGAINRAALVSADHVVIPLAADLFSLQGLRNLGPLFAPGETVGGGKKHRSRTTPQARALHPLGAMHPAGYVVMRPSVRENYPVAAYRRWIERIPRSITRRSWNARRSKEVRTPTPWPWPH